MVCFKLLVSLIVLVSATNGLKTHGGNADGADCVFPFVYRGKTYTECTVASWNNDELWHEKWCATVKNYDTEGGKWGYCSSETTRSPTTHKPTTTHKPKPTTKKPIKTTKKPKPTTKKPVTTTKKPKTTKKTPKGNYRGCFRDAKKRALPKYFNLGGKATPQLCVKTCKSKGYLYAGSQYYSQCFCGNKLGFKKLSKSKCNTPCKGNKHQMCGGAWANSIYATGYKKPKMPRNYKGCFQDAKKRALGKYFNLGGKATPQLCVKTCKSKGYLYAGSQYYSQCFCGNKVGFKKLSPSKCNTPCKGNKLQMCGGAWANSIYATGYKKPKMPGNYKGCFQDAKKRALGKYFNLGGKATPQLCVKTCKSKGYLYAGSQYYSQCFCGNKVGFKKLSPSKCKTPCKGNKLQMCGGAWANSIYATGYKKPKMPGNYKGCFQDAKKRALGKYFNLGGKATPQLCVKTCKSKGYLYAGSQYYSQCFCGNKVGFKKLSPSKCNTPCKGNKLQMCGGAWANSIYATGYKKPKMPGNYKGCFQDAKKRALGKYFNLGGKATPQLCVKTCKSKGYLYAGSQYYSQCFCGNKVGFKKLSKSKCNTPCKGNKLQMCGGAWANSIYATGYKKPKMPGNYKGCFQDAKKRALGKYFNLGGKATPQLCVKTCKSKGYLYAGSQYYSQCFCGNKVGFKKLSPSKCNTPCKGNKRQMCGGAWANSIYATGYKKPKTSGSYRGCFRDARKRALPKFFNLGGKATPQLCVKTCKSKGYKYAGVQYYSQCFCGNKLGFQKLNKSKCNTPCKGNKHLMCGGAWANAIYST